MGNGNDFTDRDHAGSDPIPVNPCKAVGALASGLGLRRSLLEPGADMVQQHGIWLDDQWAALM